MDFLNNLLSIWQQIVDAFYTVIKSLGLTVTALSNLYNMLSSFRADIVAMSNHQDATINALPVNQAIGTMRYLMGDMAFYIMYMVIMAGCLLTIMRIVTLILEANDDMLDRIIGGTGPISKLLGKIFE